MDTTDRLTAARLLISQAAEHREWLDGLVHHHGGPVHEWRNAALRQTLARLDLLLDTGLRLDAGGDNA